MKTFFFDKSLKESVYRFLNYNLESINSLNEDLEDISLLIDSMFNLFSKTVIQKNNFEVQLQESLYSIIHMNFIDSNYKYPNYHFKFYYTYFIETKDDENKNAEIRNFICDFFNSNIKIDSLIQIIETITTLDLIFIIKEFEEIFFENSLNQFDFLEAFYQYFSDERKQDIIQNWIKTDPIMLGKFFNKIDYNVPDSTKMADYILDLTKDKTDFSLNEIRYNILFKLKDLKSYDFSIYSGQIISLIISQNTEQQEIGLKELNKNKKYINEFHLQDNCEAILNGSYLNDLFNYSQNIKNIFKSDFGGKKKFINEIWNNNEDFKINVTDYLFNYIDQELLDFFSNSFFKLNYIEFVKMLINKFHDYSLNDINILNKSKPILKNILLSKYKKDFINELSSFTEKYDSEVPDGHDETIAEIKKYL